MVIDHDILLTAIRFAEFSKRIRVVASRAASSVCTTIAYFADLASFRAWKEPSEPGYTYIGMNWIGCLMDLSGTSRIDQLLCNSVVKDARGHAKSSSRNANAKTLETAVTGTRNTPVRRRDPAALFQTLLCRCVHVHPFQG